MKMPLQSARWPPLATPLVLAALTLLYMAPFLRAPTGQEALDGHDLVNQQYPLFSFIFDSVREGRGLPLWNPYQFAGQTVVGNPQSTIFYPPAWLMAPLGVGRGVGWLVVLHLWLGGWGMAAFARRLGASRAGALVGGIVYEFSALIGAHLDAGHLNYLLCQAWLPWIATAYLASVGGEHWQRGALLGAMALGLCVLTGYPPLLYFAVLWLAMLWLRASATDFRRAAWRNLRPLLVIGAGGAVLGAALLLPVGQFALVSTRAQSASLEFSNSYALPGVQLITLLFPNIFGQPHLFGDGYWGVPFYEELTAYVGILPLIAIFLARRRPAAMLMLAFVVLGLIVSLGIDGGLFPFLYRLLPGYSLFRVPSRALYFFVVGAAGLTALFISDLQTRSSDERAQMLQSAVRWGLPLVAALAIAASVALGIYFTAHSADKNPPWRIYYAASMIANTSVMIGAVWLALRAWQPRAPNLTAALALLIAVSVIDLWRIAAPLVNVSVVDVPPLWQAMARAAPASPDFRVMTVPGERIIWQAGAAYTQHLNASGYDPLISDAYKRLLDASQYNPTSPIARLLGVRYAISDVPFEKSKLPGIESLRLVSKDDGWHIYEARDPLPRAFIAPTVEVNANEAESIRRLATQEIDPAVTALVDHAVACAANPTRQTITATAQITRYSPNTVELAANSAQSGVLVLTDAYDANWVVSVDDAPAELLRADVALRGVCVPAGAHHIRFDYQPRLFFVGLVISVIGWLAAGALMVLRR